MPSQTFPYEADTGATLEEAFADAKYADMYHRHEVAAWLFADNRTMSSWPREIDLWQFEHGEQPAIARLPEVLA